MSEGHVNRSPMTKIYRFLELDILARESFNSYELPKGQGSILVGLAFPPVRSSRPLGLPGDWFFYQKVWSKREPGSVQSPAITGLHHWGGTGRAVDAAGSWKSTPECLPRILLVGYTASLSLLQLDPLWFSVTIKVTEF